MKQAVQHPLLSWGAALALWLLIGLGLFDPQSAIPLPWVLAITGVVLLWLAWEMGRGVVRYWTMEQRGERPSSSWLGLGFALLGACALMLRMTGGLVSSFYPLFYLAIAFLTSVGTSRQGAYWFGYALLLEGAAVFASLSTHPDAVGRGALHILLLGLFASSHHIYLHGLLWDMRRERNRKHDLSDMASPISLAPRATQTPPGFTASSLQSLESERQMLFSMLREGLDAHGCALLWMDDDDNSYEVLHYDTQSDDVELGPFSLQSGAPAGLFQRHNAMRISRSGDTGIHLPYYGRSVSVRSWLAVPIRQGNRVRGALCADRIHRTPFTAREESMMEAVAMIFGCALESQRSFLSSRREPESLLHLYEAGQALNRVHSEAELGEVALAQAALFAAFDWGFVSRYNPDDHTHTVIATTSDVDPLIRQTYAVENTLLGLALKHGCPLPEKGFLRSSAPLIATVDPDLPEYASVYILPLRMRDEGCGSLVMASHDPQLFADMEREKNLGTLAHHIAALLDNAQHQTFRTQLTSHDPLTQLANHRALLEALDDRFAAAQQYSKRLALLMLDIDGFHELNERYGYETGDRVLVQVARALEHLARDIDEVGRYGNDTFVLLLDEASRTHTLKIADRLVAQLSQLEFCSEGDNPELFSLTVSVGVATYPDSAVTSQTLLLGAQDAMEQAQQRGGNRVVLHSSPSSGAVHNAPPHPSKLITQPPPGWGWASSAPLPFSDDDDPSGFSDESLATRLPQLRRMAQGAEPVSVSHILEAVIQSNRDSSKEDLLGVPDLEAISAAADLLDGLPDEPPYPDSDSDDAPEHDSTAFLPENMEVMPNELDDDEQEAAALNTPAPPIPHNEPHLDLPDIPNLPFALDDEDEPV